MIYLGNSEIAKFRYWGIQLLRGQDEGGGGQNMSVFVHAHSMKIVHAVVEYEIRKKAYRTTQNCGQKIIK